MPYEDVDFRAGFMLRERQRVEKERLVAASFTAWQLLQVKVAKLPAWGRYIKQLGLSDDLPVTKEELKREADQAMKNAERIIAQARAADGGR